MALRLLKKIRTARACSPVVEKPVLGWCCPKKGWGYRPGRPLACPRRCCVYIQLRAQTGLCFPAPHPSRGWPIHGGRARRGASTGCGNPLAEGGWGATSQQFTSPQTAPERPSADPTISQQQAQGRPGCLQAPPEPDRDHSGGEEWFYDDLHEPDHDDGAALWDCV
jgi:hypothetical protein